MFMIADRPNKSTIFRPTSPAAGGAAAAAAAAGGVGAGRIYELCLYNIYNVL